MAIDFPDSPTNGQTYTVGNKTWTYNSTDTQWILSSVSPDSGTLTAQGDLLTRSNSALTKLAKGSNGDVLVTDSNATEGLRWQGQTNTGRNLIYNGAMQVAQRGTSTASITGTGYYTADRFRVEFASLGTWTQSVESDGPTGSGLRNSLKMLCTTADASPAAGDVAIFQYLAEGQDLQRIKKGTSSAEQLTLSFWVKSNVTGTYITELFDTDNSRYVSASYSVSASATWEKKTITFPADTTGTFNNDNGLSFVCNFWLGAGSTFTSGSLGTTWHTTTANRAVGQTNLAAATNNYWQITGVQLEVGAVATGFDFEPYETTLRKCQRYYYRIKATSISYPFGIAQCYGTTSAGALVFFPTTMRTRPTALEQSGTAGDYNFYSAIGSAAYLSSVPTYAGVLTTENVAAVNGSVSSGLVAGDATQLVAASSSAYLAWSAEL